MTPAPQWWVSLRPRLPDPDPRVCLLVLPHAGGSPIDYLPVVAALPDDVYVLGLCLPGRERRAAEPAESRLADVLASLENVARPGLATVLFGHNVGGLLALHLARRLGDDCAGVIVSGQTPGDRDRWLDGLTSDRDLIRLQEMAGRPPQQRGREDRRSAALAALRADLQLGAEAAKGFGDIRLAAPIISLAGRDDRIIDVNTLSGWTQHTSGPCEVHLIAGDHFAILADEHRSWLEGLLRQRLAAARRPDPRLLCLPFAGAGAGVFNAWRRTLRSPVKIVGLQLPGRENRLAEPAVRRVGDAIEAIEPAVYAEIARPGALALFGHSMGAVLAFELARWIQAVAPGRLAQLFVSGSPPPWEVRGDTATGLPDAEFIARVQRFADYHHAALAEPALRDLLLPTLRADVELHEFYVPEDRRPLPLPITAFRGREDELVTAAQIARWSEATTGRFAAEEIAGGHMYLIQRPAELLAAVERRLGR